MVGGFDERLDAATAPRWLWSCGAEPSGERAEDSAIGTCRGQIDTDVGGPLDDAGSDLDQTKAYRCELCSRQRRALRSCAAHGKLKTVCGCVLGHAEMDVVW